MKISGTATLSAPPDAVWKALNDPAVLVRTIPGCSRLETVGQDAYTMTVTAGVASIKGVYTGSVRLTDQDPPDSFVLKASGSGGPGTVSADVKVRLAGDGDATTVSYDADAVVGGMIGGVGQRMLTGVAKKTAGEFFAAVDDVLTGRAVAEPGSTATPSTATMPATPAGAAGPVFEAPGAAAASGGPSGGFVAGALVGAAAALAGALVGAWLGGRQRN